MTWCTFRDRLLLGAARSYINFLLVNAVAYCATLTKEATEQQQQLFEAGSADRCQSLVISDGDKHLVLHLRFNHIVQASFSESTSRLQCLSPLMSTHFWSLINWLRDKPNQCLQRLPISVVLRDALIARNLPNQHTAVGCWTTTLLLLSLFSRLTPLIKAQQPFALMLVHLGAPALCDVTATNQRCSD